ncbi:hypothetical protein JW906_11000 [bacterium]|nr:hypothetical protein [bacterium]
MELLALIAAVFIVAFFIRGIFFLIKAGLFILCLPLIIVGGILIGLAAILFVPIAIIGAVFSAVAGIAGCVLLPLLPIILIGAGLYILLKGSHS